MTNQQTSDNSSCFVTAVCLLLVLFGIGRGAYKYFKYEVRDQNATPQRQYEKAEQLKQHASKGKESEDFYRRAAKQGHADAQYKLYQIYIKKAYKNDIFNPNKDIKREAVKWLRKAAEQGIAEAQFKLYEYYSNIILPVNTELWEERNKLTDMYKNNAFYDDVKKQQEKVRKLEQKQAQKDEELQELREENKIWLIKAANQGHVEAKRQLNYERKLQEQHELKLRKQKRR